MTKAAGDAGTTARKVSPAFLLAGLGMAQFINTYDTVAMNVAVSKVVQDLHTTVTGVQFALAFYTLVMAAFMIPGAKLGDVWGKKRTFTLGVAMYGTGALITSLSPNLTVMILGWCVCEGLGSALMIPSIYAILPAAFKEPEQRVKAFAVMGAITGAGAALGPLICGIISTYLTWRVSFAAEFVVVLVIIGMSLRIKGPPRVEDRPEFDTLGAALSAVGIGLLVTGILQANHVSTKGFWPVIVLVGAGVLVLLGFLYWQVRRKRAGRSQLMDPAMLRVRQVQLGLPLSVVMMFMMSGALFVIPVFQQMALGFEPVTTGLTFLPNTLAMIVLSQVTARLVPRAGRKWFVFSGLIVTSVGIGVIAAMIDTSSTAWTFLPGTLLMGVGIGMVMAPLQDLIQSSVPLEKQSEISGVSRSFFNLGSSLGTAIAGAVLTAVLISGITSMVMASPAITADQKQQITAAVRVDTTTMSDEELKELLDQKNTPQELTDTLVGINSKARNRALKTALAMVALIGFIGAFLGLMLPGDRQGRPNPPGT
ncbi:MAG: MFS transporter [Actinobacteria bacterium]|nr:MFS transporter [Actinomycetota bacterium]MBU2687197.1 MFS transporter [Actinomycetota bacterium]